MTGRGDPSLQPIFLPGPAGAIFGVYRLPVRGPARLAVLFLPPFAEEMNKSRRMFTLAAQALARDGIASLAIDLHGTGDSAGDFAEARWETWQSEVAASCAWLRERGHENVVLVGLRMGGLLALDIARKLVGLERIILWQPVLAGEGLVTQFLRMDVAAQMLTQVDARSSTDALRKRLQSGETVEVAGYALAPELVSAIESLKLETLPSDSTPPIDWIEIVPDASRRGTPAGLRVREVWQSRGLSVRHRIVAGPPFWSSVEIAVAPDLVQATLDALETPA